LPLLHFCGQKINAYQIHFEMHPVYGDKRFTKQTVHAWCKKMLDWQVYPSAISCFSVTWTAASTIFTRESSYCFQRVLAIAIPSVTRVDQSKTMQDKITKSSSSSAWKNLVSGTVKFFHKFEGGHPERGC